MLHVAFNVPSYEHLQGTNKPNHMGSQSHMGSSGGPSGHPAFGGGTVGGSGAKEHDPGGATKVGRGAPAKNPQSDD